jgi:hypothetical protein
MAQSNLRLMVFATASRRIGSRPVQIRQAMRCGGATNPWDRIASQLVQVGGECGSYMIGKSELGAVTDLHSPFIF